VIVQRPKSGPPTCFGILWAGKTMAKPAERKGFAVVFVDLARKQNRTGKPALNASQGCHSALLARSQEEPTYLS
jgi:hypothetical protein